MINVAEGECKFVINAHSIGNIARFFNHSCDPNMATYSVFIDTDDSYRHELAFFSTRAIESGEELTFDYGGFNGGNGGFGMQKTGLATCACGSVKCRGVLPIPLA